MCSNKVVLRGGKPAAVKIEILGRRLSVQASVPTGTGMCANVDAQLSFAGFLGACTVRTSGAVERSQGSGMKPICSFHVIPKFVLSRPKPLNLSSLCCCWLGDGILFLRTLTGKVFNFRKFPRTGPWKAIHAVLFMLRGVSKGGFRSWTGSHLGGISLLLFPNSDYSCFLLHSCGVARPLALTCSDSRVANAARPV